MSNSLYHSLYKAYASAHPTKNGVTIQKTVNELWKELKLSSKTKEELDKNTNLKIKNLLEIATTKKAGAILFYTQVSSFFWP